MGYALQEGVVVGDASDIEEGLGLRVVAARKLLPESGVVFL